MKYLMVCVRDRAGDVFGVPNFVASLGSAIRGFSDEVNRADPQNILNRHPEDFDLFSLGTYDDATGSFVAHIPKQIAVGKDVLVASEGLRHVGDTVRTLAPNLGNGRSV